MIPRTFYLVLVKLLMSTGAVSTALGLYTSM
jgi:hypothetical protein